LAVLVPAHDERDLIERCVMSLREQSHPAVDLVVVADNCSDETAVKAERAGARVLVRTDADRTGKGHALRWAMDSILASRPDVDAIVVVDADSVAAPGLLRLLAAHCTDGVEVVQADYTALVERDELRGRLRTAAFLLAHRVRFGGRAALGLPCGLVGNGMLFTRRLLERYPWSAFTGAEDLEYGVDLRLSGVRPVFAPAAHVAAPVAAAGRGARTQRHRWEGGRAHVVRTRLPKVLRRVVAGDFDLLDLAVDLAVPPLGVLASALVLGGAVAALAVGAGAPAATLAPWLVGAGALAGFVLIGLVAARAPRGTYAALLVAPAIVAVDMLHRLSILRRGGATAWERTERPSDRVAERPGSERAVVAGVPIDAVDLDGAADAVLAGARGYHPCEQVCTVNLDFLVSARRRDEVRTVLASSALNVADGAPVVWLGRLTGHRVPARVAGSDLVPKICEGAARRGRSVFLLGGESGSALAAAERLRELCPGLRVVGVREPPQASLDDMDDGPILDELRRVRPDILFVALGHPKQELWIHRHREALPCRVAIGVGGTFDLLGGKLPRAPRWMQRAGCEWLYRLAREPRRLARRYALDLVVLLAVLLPLTVEQRVMTRRS
jgi:exopolysaccharide biosynthesis WecB/TagA/CpsF family protein